jgi:hypothetical protein
MSEVFLRFRHTVLPRDTPLAQFDTKRVMIQTCQACRLCRRQPTEGIVARRQFDLHMPLALSWAQRKTGQNRVVELQGDAHEENLAGLVKGVKAGSRAGLRCLSVWSGSWAWREHSLQLTGLLPRRKLAFEVNAVGSGANSMFVV